MSKLEKLIKELCPDGVEYKKVGDICEVITGGEAPKNSIKGKKPIGEYIYPIFSNGIGENSIWGFTKSYRIDRWAVTFSSIGTIGYPTLREPFFTPIIRLKVIYPKDEKILNISFLKYVLEIVEFKKQKSSVPNINANMIKNITIPIPPLEVQREIVRILDNFSSLTSELTTNLTAELTARKKQYEYYRNHLLTYDDSVKVQTLGEVCNISAGGDAPKEAMTKEMTEKFYIPIISNGIRENALYGYTNIAKINTPAVTIAARGTIGYAEYRDYPYFPIIRLLSAIPKDTSVVDTKYLYYCLQGKQYSVPMGGIPQLTAPELKKVKIPVPNIEEQQKIVDILDRFDSLCNSISEGLPAEIEARKKQYEYYRDKLLSFKKL